MPPARAHPPGALPKRPLAPPSLQETELVLEAGWEALEMAIHLFPLVSGNEVQLVRVAPQINKTWLRALS